MNQETKQFAGRPAYSYLRFSSKRQAFGRSEARQLEASRAWCLENGAELVEEMQDKGKSAYTGANRMSGALGAFLGLVEAGKIAEGSVLIIENLDRITREEILEALETYLAIIRNGVVLVVLHNNSEHSRETIRENPAKLFEAIIEMGRAHQESAYKGKRAADAWADGWKQARAGRMQSQGRPPVWLSRIPKDEWADKPAADCYTVDEAKAKTVRRIYREFAAGKELTDIARGLNVDGVPVLTAGNRKPEAQAPGWKLHEVRKYLRYVSVVGTLQRFERNGKHKRARTVLEEFLGHYPAIVGEKLYAEVARRFRANEKRYGNAGAHWASKTEAERSGVSAGGAKISKRNPFGRVARATHAGSLRFMSSVYRRHRDDPPGKRYEFFYGCNYCDPDKLPGSWNFADFSELFVAVCRQALKTPAHLRAEERELATLEQSIAEAETARANLLDGLEKATTGHELIAGRIDAKVDELAGLEKVAAEVRGIIKAGKPDVELPADFENREALGCAVRANVKTLEVDPGERRFFCELFNGVSYAVEVSPAGRVFVSTDDFVPAEILIKWRGKARTATHAKTKARHARTKGAA